MIFIVKLVDKSQKNPSQRLWKYGTFGLIRYFGSTKIPGISRGYSTKACVAYKDFQIHSKLMKTWLRQISLTNICKKIPFIAYNIL